MVEIVDAGPYRDANDVTRWRLVDLQYVICERFGVTYFERGISSLLTRLSFSHVSSRSQHPAQDPGTSDAFKKIFGRMLEAHIGYLPKGQKLEV